MAEMKKGGLLDGAGSDWDETKRSRVPEGNPNGGQFTSGSSNGGFKKEKSITDAASSEGDENAGKGQREKLAALVGKPEGTYDLETGKPVSYNSGYQVSFQQTSDSYTDEEYDAKVEEMIKRTGSIAHGGVYGGDAEISFHADSRDVALEIAVEYNQESILDWAAVDRGDWDNAFIPNTQYNAETNKTKKELK